MLLIERALGDLVTATSETEFRRANQEANPLCDSPRNRGGGQNENDG